MPLPANPVLPFRGAAPCGVDLLPEFAVFAGQGPYLVDLWAGEKMEVATGVPSIRSVPYIGNAAVLESSPGTWFRWSRARRTTMTNTDITIAVVIQFGTLSGANILSTGITTGIGLQYAAGTSSISLTKYGVADIANMGVVSTDIPYFVGVTYRAVDGIARSVVRRLDTGAHTAYSGSNASAPTDGNGYVNLCGNGTPDASLGMAVLSYQYLGPDQLLAWAMDPWGPFVADEFPWLTPPAAPSFAYPPVSGAVGAMFTPIGVVR